MTPPRAASRFVAPSEGARPGAVAPGEDARAGGVAAAGRPDRGAGARAWGGPQVARLLALAVVEAGDAAGSALRAAASRRPDAVRHKRRERSLARLVRTLGALKGPFAKAGQFAALRHDVLAPDVTAALAGLRDRVPPLPFPRIRAAVEAELGAPLERLFADFEAEPIGAASIAQVHRARLPSGEAVAVKVQYPWLRGSLGADLAIARLLVWAAGARVRLGAADRRRLFGEFAGGLRDELDFEREARVAREIGANLASDPRIRVPEVHPSHSSGRVLTMAYHPAVRVTDREALARLGVSPRTVLEIVAGAYAKQVFVDGLFHADPHPGNLFVIDEPSASRQPRVLFVDFGLSRRLSPRLRRGVRRGVFALMRREPEAFVAAMDELGMVGPGAAEGVRRAVGEMLQEMGSAGALALPGSRILALKDRAKALLRDTPGLSLPNDLLLYAKTMSYVFALGAELAPEVDLVKLSLPHLLQLLGERDDVGPAA